MELDFEKLVLENMAAIFALVGVILGAALTVLKDIVLKKQEYRLKIWERIIDRRMTAHENIISLVQDIRTTTQLGGLNSDGKVKRRPTIMESSKVLSAWRDKFSGVISQHNTWLTNRTVRELNFVQDYLVNLSLIVGANCSDEAMSQIGELVLFDFIDLAQSLERSAFEFYEEDVWKLRLNNLRQGHKYKHLKTIQRLQKTILFVKESEIRQLSSSN